AGHVGDTTGRCGSHVPGAGTEAHRACWCQSNTGRPPDADHLPLSDLPFVQPDGTRRRPRPHTPTPVARRDRMERTQITPGVLRSVIEQTQDKQRYQELFWEGSFWDYL